MKLFLKYLKGSLAIYAVFLLFGIIFAVSFSLYHLPILAVIYPYILCVVAGIIFTFVDFLKMLKRHKTLTAIKSITDAIETALPEQRDIESDDYKEIIRLICDEHKAFRANSNKNYYDMVDYYTIWAHQIKTPIASMRLNLQNEDSALSRKLSADLFRIEQYVEMVLTFLRLNSDSTDYVIKEYDLDNIIKSAVKKFSHTFFAKKISLIYEPCSKIVITDEKWLSFVIEQVLSNALKYTKNGRITILVSDNKLQIRDTGIGIAKNDLPRIFENGYTGAGGRTDKKASGIGLYLCKRICTNLGHTISAESEIDKGTVITVDLAQDKRRFE